jgi:AbrB family looped-hinge helix DNA binding protein
MLTLVARAGARLTPAMVRCNLTGKTNQRDQMIDTSTTTLSSKGQVVIPEKIREQLGLAPGTKFVVIAEGDVVMFKVLDPPPMREFLALLKRGREVAKKTGLRRSDITKAIAKVRRSP